ncbi:MAG: aldehyde dehydrogenase family protein [Candidatus Gastranaerophilales bacterium]|nr:aldehyde dehydrogenase family protein [Candidatus Gastranaerophilales bacterium]
MDILEKQRKFFNTGKTRDLNFKLNILKNLKKAILNNTDVILEALKQDLNKSRNEAFFSEIYPVIEEINLFIKNLKKWEKPKKVKTPLILFSSKSFIYNEPYGVVLIISPWNYPFQLPIMPLIGAIAAGNCAILKLSEYSIATSDVVAKILKDVFEEQYICPVLGRAEAAQNLLKENFDYIFYTGNSIIGKKVMMAASDNLTPITLELGGKSPCIVDKTANVDLSAKRIASGKFLNSGQTCVAPDFILVQKSVTNELKEKLKKYIVEFFGEEPLKNDNYPSIINERHFNRLNNLIQKSNIIYGGKTDFETLKIEPALISANFDDEVMKDEIFGPLLPIIEYEKINEVILKLKTMPKPLALYCFTQDKIFEKNILKELSFGGGCINETMMHLMNSNLPFGGVGYSGIGAYHGKASYDTFTHKKSILRKSNFLYFPYYSIMTKSKIDFAKLLKK